MKKKLKNLINSIKKAPDRKHYLEFVTAALSIPVLLTVILLNLNSLRSNKDTKNNQPIVSTQPQIIIKEDKGNSNSSSYLPRPTNTELCKKEVGPITISYPKEGSTITDNPVNFIIKHSEEYCSVVWSYKINNSPWSEYSNNAPSVYNMPNGNVKFQLRVQSTVSNDSDNLEVNFNYQGSLVSASPNPTSSLSPTPGQ